MKNEKRKMQNAKRKTAEPLTLTLSPEYRGEGTREAGDGDEHEVPDHADADAADGG
jgi:hypothetical protein